MRSTWYMESKLKHLCELINAHSWPSSDVGKWRREPGIHIGTKEAIFSSEGIRLAGEVLYEKIIKINPPVDAIAGDGVGGAALAITTSIVAGYKGKKITPLNVRIKSELARNKLLIEGSNSLPNGANIVVVDDTIDTGRSINRVIEVIEDLGYKVVAAIFLVSKQDSAIIDFNKKGIQSTSLLRLEEINPLESQPKMEAYHG